MRESGENYLETILMLQKRLGSVRSIDIANELEYSKPSISRAMGILKDDGYIAIDKGGYIELTDKGHEKAEEVYERHVLIQKFLMERCRLRRTLQSRTPAGSSTSSVMKVSRG